MTDAFISGLSFLVQKAPEGWLDDAHRVLRGQPPTAAMEFVLQRMPATSNADLAYAMADVIRLGAKLMPWESIGWAVKAAQATSKELRSRQHLELLWSGPSPLSQIPARRIDQALSLLSG